MIFFKKKKKTSCLDYSDLIDSSAITWPDFWMPK